MNQLIARGVSFGYSGVRHQAWCLTPACTNAAPGTPGAGGMLSNAGDAGVENEERGGRPTDPAREALDRVHVQARGVVAEKRSALGGRRAGGSEEPGRAEDGGMRVVDV